MVAAPLSQADQVAVFDREAMKKRRMRAAADFDDYSFLFDWAQRQITDRLSDIKREFPTSVQLGMRGGAMREGALALDVNNSFSPHCISDDEFLPLKAQSLDLVMSNLHMHSINDLPGSLLQIRRALKPDGLFIASIFGGETLHELRACLTHSEMQTKGGVSPRVFPFADKQQMGALLQRAGFALPVVDSDILTVTYDNAFKLMTDLRGMGESNIIAARDKRNPGKDFFMKTAQHYAENYAEEDGRIAASFEIIFLLGWAPHESQQKPLKPGSADTYLGDVLK